MSTDSESQGRTVFVLGAGFTRAFLPTAPLMVDDYGVSELIDKFSGFSHASLMLDRERLKNPNGNINIERLLTRLDGLMPYDFDQSADQELRMLSTEVTNAFVQRIQDARNGEVHSNELNAFAQYCLNSHIDCITFNYDDILDEALYINGQRHMPSVGLSWNPEGGYGFFCRPSIATIREPIVGVETRFISMLLLKLHGSVNWRPRRGYPKPYFVDAIMHHEPWSYSVRSLEIFEEEGINLHLEPDFFIIPPVLIKSALVEQPILRLVWHRAYQVLAEARKVVFIGYSFPLTDIAVRTLFDESLRDLPRSDISIVNFATVDEGRQEIIDRYQTVFGDIPAENFDFRGALEWSREIVGSGVGNEEAT